VKSIGTLILAAALAACGGTEQAAPAPYIWGGIVTITGGTAATVTVTYRATGPDPANVSVPAGGSIQWVNADTVAHWPESFSHCTVPRHQQCAWLNLPAALAPNGQMGDRVTVGPAPATPASCGFHDDAIPPPCGGGGGY